ncbi:MAG: CPBP family intramembrane glutamic endopeptidase [Desulfitobacteriaceae bacterium]
MSILKIPPRRPAWNVWQVFFLIGLVNLLEYFLGWLSIQNNLDSLPGFIRFVGIGLGECILYLAAIIVLLRVLNRSYKDIGLRSVRWSYLLLSFLVGIFLFLGIGLLGKLLTYLLGVPVPQSFTVVLQGTKYFWQLLILLVLGGIVAPLKEEVLFRGLFYPTLRRAYGRGKGIIFTGIFFATLHFDLIRFLPLFIGGIVLTWLYERSSSLWPSIVAHGTWNVLMALAIWIQR